MKQIYDYIAEKLHLNKNSNVNINIDITAACEIAKKDVEKICELSKTLDKIPYAISNKRCHITEPHLRESTSNLFLYYTNEYETTPYADIETNKTKMNYDYIQIMTSTKDHLFFGFLFNKGAVLMSNIEVTKNPVTGCDKLFDAIKIKANKIKFFEKIT